MRNDTLAFVNVGVSPSTKLILVSSAKKVAPSGPPIINDNVIVSLYMETQELSVYNQWVKDLAIFPSHTVIKSQQTPFDETWSIIDNDPRFKYYTVTYKILTNSAGGRISSLKPIIYSVELRRFYKP